MDSGIARGRVRTTANDDDDDGGVAQDGGHKGTSKPNGGLIFRGLSGAQRGYTIC